MNINKAVILTWEGQDYPLIINMRHIDHIEASGINLLAMIRDCAIAELKMSGATKLIAVLLQIAGAKGLDGTVEEAQEKVWSAMCENGDVSISQVIDVVSEILGVVFFRSKKKSTKKNKKKAKQ